MRRPSHHDRLWGRHPAVTSGAARPLGERAADRMKATLATWTALALVLAVIGGWMVSDGAGVDRFPWILLNLMLSCFAALQCFVLLIAGKRGEQIAAELAQHTFETTETICQMQAQQRELIEENTALTKQVADLAETTRRLVVEVHAHVAAGAGGDV